MLSHFHKCFDARLISIHPETRRIRAFADYDILTQYHGQLAHLPEYIDSKALRHHWDMCCLENLRSSWLEQESEQSTVGSTPTPRIPLANSVDQSSQSNDELSQQTFLPPPVPSSLANLPTNPQHAKQASDLQTPDPTGKSQASKPRLHHSSYKLRCTHAHPLSPPSSEPAPERQTLWWFGDDVVDDAAEAEALAQKGLLLRPADESDFSSKTGERILRRNQKQRAGEPQLWYFGDKVIGNAAEAEALMKQGWLLQPIDEENDDHDEQIAEERSADSVYDAQRHSRHSDGRAQWHLGAVVIEDPAVAEDLMKQGWLLQTVRAGDEECHRGRSPTTRPCISTDGDLGTAGNGDEHLDSALRTKRQRLTSPP
jgi:hypothetical protein